MDYIPAMFFDMISCSAIPSILGESFSTLLRKDSDKTMIKA
jgi:hypothetical protein